MIKSSLFCLSFIAVGFGEIKTALAQSKLTFSSSDRLSSERIVKVSQSNSSFQSQTETTTTVPAGNNITISEIEVRFVDKNGDITTGQTKPTIIIREFALQPGDVYNQKLALQGLNGVRKLDIVDLAKLTLEPGATTDEAVMVVTVAEKKSAYFAFGLTLEPPTALQGTVKPNVVHALSNSSTGTSGGVRFGLRNLGGTNQQASLGIEGGEQKFGFNLGYRNYLRHDTGYGINFFNQRNVEPEFDEGDIDVDLPDDNDPWIHRIGGGMEYFQPLARDFVGAIGISYQRISVRERAFSKSIEARDELGDRLTVSDDGQDDLLTINFAAVLDRQNNSQYPTEGFKLQFGSDQSIPVGDASIVYNRLAANYTHYLPLNLFGFTEGARTLVLNFQGGTILGEVPPYEAFTLGGSSSVRGYGSGELSTGRSFIQATAEYRYPISAFRVFKRYIDVGGTFFIDYGSDLGTNDDVIGRPAQVRDKPNSGLGYGLGLRALTPVGAVRLEFALNDEGDSEIIFAIGDRF
ncbi:BamA/TamA family outer membrane protein [Myxosarcina sp. GI1]|uniref:BamA/TamA family outer membrane protein n=1 Tax=Myxosarcina sp. GI1 TaxID=1541065 RepID=UPI0005660E6C|nr:BamA/TamA family outer membrane protein [Myxosarcina sp. GI1]